jgi:uncharacterized coiled-coil protein SlyX
MSIKADSDVMKQVVLAQDRVNTVIIEMQQNLDKAKEELKKLSKKDSHSQETLDAYLELEKKLSEIKTTFN